jgi:vacuolar-type H+-ATPase subunit E/Vma4
MRIVEEKIDKFAQDIMADVGDKREKIMEQTDKELEAIYEEKELSYLSKAYEIIQNGLKNIEKEKNEILSKAIMDSKRKILKVRESIISNVFKETENKLIEFTEDKEYLQYLISIIEEDMSKVGDGDIIIYISHSDEKFLRQLNNIFDEKVVVADKNEKFIGGCKILNKSKNIFLDDSFYSKLYSQKETFLNNCNLEIE